MLSIVLATDRWCQPSDGDKILMDKLFEAKVMGDVT
jgi:hypothetical protein